MTSLADSGSTLPRLLYLGHNLPYPPHEGALIRSFHTVRLLSQAFDVSAIYFFRRGAHRSEEERASAVAELQRLGSATVQAIPQESSRARLASDHLRSLVTGRPYTHWMHEAPAVRRTIEALLRRDEVDLVHVDSLDLIAYLPMFEGLPVVLAHHNVESQLLRRRADPEGPLKRAYIRHQANLVEQAERVWACNVALNVVVSEADDRLLSEIAPGAETLLIPNGVDTAAFSPGESEDLEGGIVFVGGHSWFPNRDGMEYFATQVLPLLRRTHPQVPVQWIGKAPDAARRHFRELGIQMLGYVEDIRPTVSAARCAIVPLRVGGGTRLKILDAWAMGKAVVSTSLGCEGLRTEHGENILIADAPEGFAAAIAKLLDEPDVRRRLERNARTTAVEHYDWGRLGEIMRERYLRLVAPSRANDHSPE